MILYNFYESIFISLFTMIKTYKSTFISLFTMILCTSENNIRDIKAICRPLFGLSRVVKYTSSLLQ